MPKENSGDDNLEKNANSDNAEWDNVADELEDLKTDMDSSAESSSDPKNAEAEKSAEFSELKKTDVIASSRNIDFILDVPLDVTVELGRTSMPIYDLLQLGQGSIVELNKLAGEPLEVLVNQKLIARGEVVVVNEKFGIRLTDIVSPKERVEKLR